MILIKHTRSVESKMETSSFLQRVFNLFDIYSGQKIVVNAKSKVDVLVVELQIVGLYEFDYLKAALYSNLCDAPLLCEVKVE